MFAQQFLDPISIPGVFLLIVLLLLGAYEVGFRIGRWWQIRTPEETEGPTDALVGSIIAFLAFLLAITMGMASDRFDTRRALVLDEDTLRVTGQTTRQRTVPASLDKPQSDFPGIQVRMLTNSGNGSAALLCSCA